MLFTWRTFRPDAVWAAALVAVFSGMAVLSIILQTTTQGFAGAIGSAPSYWLGFIGRALATAWTGVESLAYHQRMQRRLKLGLAEPLLTNRFLLWGVSACAGALTFVVSGTTLLLGLPDTSAVVVALRLAGGVCGLVAAGAQWFAFFPPAAYRRWWLSDKAPGSST